MFWYLILVGAAAFVVTMFFVNNVGHEINYHDFLRLIEVSRLDEQGKPVNSSPHIVVKKSVAEGRFKFTRYRNLRDLRNGLQTISGLVDIEELAETSGQEPVGAALQAARPRERTHGRTVPSGQIGIQRGRTGIAAETGGIPTAVQQRAGTQHLEVLHAAADDHGPVRRAVSSSCCGG